MSVGNGSTELSLSQLPVSGSVPAERGDAARNRALLLTAARQLISDRGSDAVTMDDVAAAAGVGKGTLFRRFGSRAGLMIVLLDEDEKVEQRAFMFGPPPLGPGAPPLERLIAYGRSRLQLCMGSPRAAVRCGSGSADAVQRAREASPLPRANAARNPPGTTGDLDAHDRCADLAIGWRLRRAPGERPWTKP